MLMRPASPIDLGMWTETSITTPDLALSYTKDNMMLHFPPDRVIEVRSQAAVKPGICLPYEGPSVTPSEQPTEDKEVDSVIQAPQALIRKTLTGSIGRTSLKSVIETWGVTILSSSWAMVVNKQ